MDDASWSEPIFFDMLGIDQDVSGNTLTSHFNDT
jgi:hypothetical protein